MTSIRFPRSSVKRPLAAVVVALLATNDSFVLAANTDIANIPLVNASTSRVLPNIWFILDDSGSMAWETIPGATNHNQFIPGGNAATHFWRSAHCNGLAYNPGITYAAPPTFTATTYPDQNYLNANSDGFAKTGSNNLTGKIYFEYTGSELDVAFTYNGTGTAADVNSNFYKECNSTPVATITVAGSTSCSVTSVKVNGTELLSAVTSASNNPATIASRIATNINTSGYAAMTDPSDNTRVWIYSGNVADATKAPVVSPTSCGSGGSKTTFTTGAFPSTATLAGAGFGKFKPYKLTAGSGTTVQRNYANWFAYYRSRIMMAKSSIGLAFADVRGTPKSFADDPTDGDYFHARVGFSSLWNTGGADLSIAAFDTGGAPSYGQKGKFYSRLYGSSPNSGTPLRQKLEAAGEMYVNPPGGRDSASDPIKFYCQRNNALLTTDGYWNGTSSSAGNQDGGGTPRPQFEGPSTSSNNLADVAMKYYQMDMRVNGDGGVWNLELPKPDDAANTKIDDVARWQHMTTFTVGMGVDGTLQYDSGYKTTTNVNSDFYKILNNTGKNWPLPEENKPSAVDDLWHAAVNGRGTYFSAKNPRALAANIRQALSEMNVENGGGSANSTGSLSPTPGTDNAYTASYKTAHWTGDVNAYGISNTGDVDDTTSLWSASSRLQLKIAADGKSDSRTIYTGKVPPMVPFTSGNVLAANFDNTKLNQYAYDWGTAQKSAATVSTLVNYLRGHSQYEIRGGATAQLYRTRNSVLGDIVHSQPIYVGKPSFVFENSEDTLDSGYQTFKDVDNASRPGTIYVGANDGMLHAFDAANGDELWAYVPSILHANMWRLADVEYRTNHRYFVDGPIAVMDAKINGAWATVLVGALGAGGRGYYALDITAPTSPKLLWNFTAENDADVGYTLGTPVIVKVGGEWVAVLASGYNNVIESDGRYPGGSGKGYVFVVRLKDGTLVRKISTGEGSTATPSGLATINVEVASGADYTARKAYGGDLLGNMYRFDLSSSSNATKLIQLGVSQPITSAPEIARPDGIANPPYVFFGTGRYLGKSDIQETNPAMQAFYAVKDDGSTKTTGALAHHTLTAGNLTPGGTSSDGWYADLATSRERVHIHPQVQLGVVLFVSTIPPEYKTLAVKNSYTKAEQLAECEQSKGEGYLYQLAYKTGTSVDGISAVGTYLDSPPVGLVLIGTHNLPPYSDPKTADGKFHVNTGGGKTVSGDIKKPPMTGSDGKASRVQWRELLK